MPIVGFGEDDSSTIAAEQIKYRRPRNQQPISETDPNHPPQIPSIIQSTRCKSTISSLLLSNSTPNNDSIVPKKKKNFPSGTFRGLGCAASSEVSVPAVIQSSANWEEKRARKKKKKQRSLLGKKSRDPHQGLATASNHPSSAAAMTSVVIPDVCCGPGIGFTTDAASVDCVVSRRPVSGRVRDFNGDRMNQREREVQHAVSDVFFFGCVRFAVSVV